jgi:hypothetical protein
MQGLESEIEFVEVKDTRHVESSITEGESDPEDDDIKADDPSIHLTERDWMHIMYPNITNRNLGETFLLIPFLREFMLHLLHPFLTPFVWALIRVTKGRNAAHLFLTYHSWNLSLESLKSFSDGDREDTVLSTRAFKNDLIQIILWFFFNIFIHGVPWLLLVLAFIHQGGTQNYTHEAVYAVTFRALWTLAVGVKYGFYSEKLLSVLYKRPLPQALMQNEQLMNNWSPKLDRLMFELRVASFGLPISTSKSMISVSKNHPIATYCLQCKELGDVPLCLLRPSAIHTLLLNLPADNFHKIFWSKPPPVIRSEGKTYTRSVLDGTKESFSSYLTETPGHYGSGSSRSTTPEDLSPIVALKQTSEHSAAEVAINPLKATFGFGSSYQTSSARKRHQSLFVGETFISESHSPKLESQKEVLKGAVGYVQVPAVVLLAYCVARSWSFGGNWIGTNAVSSKAGMLIAFASSLSYLIPGAMRVVEVCRQRAVFVLFEMCNSAYSLPSATCLDVTSAASLFATGESPCSSATIGLTSSATCAGLFVPSFGFVSCCPSWPSSYLNSVAVRN